MRYPYWRYYNYNNIEPKNYQNNEKEPSCIIEEEYCDYFDLGDPAPDFTTDAIVNGERTKVSLSDYIGKWVVLFFYGSDFTFVWPTELAAVADHYNEFKRLNTEVLAISTDSIYSHKIFTETSPSGMKINYPLLSDRTQKISKSYGILNEDEGFAYRAAFIIDPEGKIRGWITNPQPVGRNIDEILRIIAGLQFTERTGLGAPAGWKPGDPGIRVGWNYVGKY